MSLPDIRLRRLIYYNIGAAVIVSATLIASTSHESFVLTLGGFAAILALLALGIASAIAAFSRWKSYGWWSLAPIASFIACAALTIVATRFGTSLVLAGTPMRPDTFPRGKVKADLEQIAAKLLGHSLKHISTRSDSKVPLVAVAGAAPETVPADLLRRLNAFGFDAVSIDDAQSLVVYLSYHRRSWRKYLYASTGTLAPAYSRQSTITPVDIEAWEELPKIARGGAAMTPQARDDIAFEPTVAYPTLRQALGEDQLNAIGRSDASALTPEQKALALRALNEQRLVSSRLVENPCITLGDTERFHLTVGCQISDSFWVSRLVQALLAQGTLQRADDGHHLRIRKNLTELEQRQVEWVHVGLMNFLYGNLLEKPDFHYSKDLGDGWYFESD